MSNCSEDGYIHPSALLGDVEYKKRLGIHSLKGPKTASKASFFTPRWAVLTASAWYFNVFEDILSQRPHLQVSGHSEEPDHARVALLLRAARGLWREGHHALPWHLLTISSFPQAVWSLVDLRRWPGTTPNSP